MNTQEFEKALAEERPFMLKLSKELVKKTTLDAEDIVQDTMLQALEKLHLCRGPLRPWLRVVLTNVFIRAYRIQKKSFTIPIMDKDYCMALSHNPIREYFKDYVDPEIKEAFKPLTCDQKWLLQYLYGEELSYEEISQSTGKSVMTIKDELFKARKAIRDFLGEDYEQDLSIPLSIGYS